MGYLRGSQEKRKSKNGDTVTQNHVDRVRVQDPTYEFGGPGRGSGWRQRSLSNIDLTSQSRHSFTKQIRDYSSGLYDLYSRIESRKDYAPEGLYGATPAAGGADHSAGGGEKRKRHEDKGESIYEHIVPTIDPGVLGADSCSLRRTRSLAVIREETYNDLQISGVRTRRSQLIPRAKLCNSSFFKNRSKQKYREEDSGSGVDTQTSETRESDDYYANLKKLETEKTQITTVWTTDKSDLDSLDSDYFKNSLHQPSVSNIFVNASNKNTANVANASNGGKQKHVDTKYQILEIEVHNQNIRHSCSTTTETSVTHSEQTSETYSSRKDETTTTTNSSTFEEVTLRSEEKEQQSEESAENGCELNINYNTLTLTHHHLQCESNQGTYEKKIKFKEDRKSVVSYDSIYLSSEDSNEHTLVNEIIEDPLPEIIISSEGEFVDVSLIHDAEDERTESDTTVNIDSLYSQINKTRPKVVSLEPKTNLTSFSDTSTRGTLERLTFISSTPASTAAVQHQPALAKDHQPVEGKLFSTEPYVGTLIDNQYCSLPDVNIGISLRASERIDAKLRQSCVVVNSSSSTPVVPTAAVKVVEEAVSNQIYDSISRFGRAHKRLRQRENFDIVVHQPITVEEQPKEAPTIEVATPSKSLFEKKGGGVNPTLVPQPPPLPPPPPQTTVTAGKSFNATLVRPQTKSNQPKVKKILPSTIALGKKQVIVDELAAKVNQAIKKENELKQFKHVSKTDVKHITQNPVDPIKTPTKIPSKVDIKKSGNVPQIIKSVKTYEPVKSTNIVKDSKIPKPPPVPTSAPPPVPNSAPPPLPISAPPPLPIGPTSILKKVPIKPKRSVTDLTHETLQLHRKNSEQQLIPKTEKTEPEKASSNEEPISISNKIAAFKSKNKTTEAAAKEALRNEFKANLTDTLRKRIAQSRELFNARPIRIASVDNIAKLNDTYEISPTLKYKVQFKEQASVGDKMSRPQILNVVDAKRVCSVAPRQNNGSPEISQVINSSSVQQQPQTHVHAITAESRHEFQEKVDAVRCYWSKLVEAKQQQQQQKDQADGSDEVDHIEQQSNQVPEQQEERNCVTNADNSSQEAQKINSRLSVIHRELGDEVSSFSPLVEIIELDGHKQAAVVNAQHFEVQNFDHVRYKVMKSATFQKNIRTNARKEAQFDGLLQYLQDYSFQELLANNNVVIIEPIRTKIEKISEKSNESQTLNCKITGGSGTSKTGTNESYKNGLKRHFFYHPIRVNKELLDEELPTPDTVKNARKVFEETLRLRAASGTASMGFTKDENASKSSENLRKKALRHLSIDTTYSSSGTDTKTSGERKWDSSSLSSGISSGELSSPCECNDHVEQKDMFSSEENICDDELCESYYVSQDVLAKIRECGSSVTYYGGRVVDNKSPEVSPMTKAIMQEIRGDNTVCGVCQPNHCPHAGQLFPSTHNCEDSMGLKFKLVKSNSCSSRLELAGTGLDEEQLRHNQTLMEDIHNRTSSPVQDAEESVRTLVSRLEFGHMQPKTKPRIIESRCIEKQTEPVSNAAQQEQSPLASSKIAQSTAQSLEELARLKPVVDLIAQVTVNSHINFSSPALVAASVKQQLQTQSKPPATNTKDAVSSPVGVKIGRNRNVDLAISMCTNANATKGSAVTMPVPKTTVAMPAAAAAISAAADKESKYPANATNTQQQQQQQVNSMKNAKNLLINERGDTVGPVVQQMPTQSPAPKVIQVGAKSNGSGQSAGAIAVGSKDNAVPESLQSQNNGAEDAAVNNHPGSGGTISGNNGGNGGVRLVKWNTLSKFDEKNYVTNDAKLKQKPKYDEIEFEEFEVFDPNNPPNNGECYDSLNDK